VSTPASNPRIWLPIALAFVLTPVWHAIACTIYVASNNYLCQH
jgi:hypothetical protein